jgi:hypothetical protein
MKSFINLNSIGIVLTLVLVWMLYSDNQKKDKLLHQYHKELITAIQDAKESSYETGCNNGSGSSCELLKDMKDRYENCLKSALENCKTWAIQYKEEDHNSAKGAKK